MNKTDTSYSSQIFYLHFGRLSGKYLWRFDEREREREREREERERVIMKVKKHFQLKRFNISLLQLRFSVLIEI